MMHLLKVLVILAVLVGVGYIALFKRGAASRVAQGYTKAETPQVAADMFVKAITARDYDIAADYCVKDYAEQLRRCGDEAKEFGTRLDNLTYQMNERGMIRDEVKVVFTLLDPFPSKDLKIVVGKENGESCMARMTFGVTWPANSTQPNSGTWQLKPEIFNVYIRSMKFVGSNVVDVPMRKETEGWKFAFPVDSSLQLRVGHMKEKYQNYVNPFKLVTQEVKTDPTTKENATSRLKTLLEQAAKE